MEVSKNTEISPREHIETIFQSFSVSSRVLESFINLSNTVIDTALSGQNKFVFEILQNADDSCNDLSKDITVQFILQNGYLIIQHNGKEFDFFDVERICDFASTVNEVKATDISKTGYKGLGFKSLFNISKCIYICSGGYSFHFDKTYWSNPKSKPWQVIPVWSEDLPLSKTYKYDESNVNFILSVKKAKQLEKHLMEIIDHPEFFLYLHHVNNFRIKLFGKEQLLERKVEDFGLFAKYNFYKNQSIVSTWLSRTFQSAIPTVVQNKIRKGSKYTYPDKFKEATEVPLTFTIETDTMGKKIKSMSNALCFNTLPTQLQLTLPYHVNSFFILNLDRTQLDENDFNEFIFEQIGYLQLNLLKDLAAVPHLKSFIVELFSPEIKHPYSSFNKAFSRGLSRANNIAWLPARAGSHLLKLGEAWIDEIHFFKQNFKDIRNTISRNIIDYDVTKQYLLPAETKRFTYEQLFNDFSNKYYPQLKEDSYIRFIRYLYNNLNKYTINSDVIGKLKDVAFLRTKNGTLISPKKALLEESNNAIPHFFELNPVDNKYLPLSNDDALKDWLGVLGAKRLKKPSNILRESLLKWIDYNCLGSKINTENHIDIINYIANNSELLTKDETEKLKENLLVFTESKEFKLMKTCYLPEESPIKELEDVISHKHKIFCGYDMDTLKKFLIRLDIHNKLTPINLFRETILDWIKKNEVISKLTKSNYTAIIEYFASQYSKIEEKLTQYEKSYMKKMSVLTCAQIFQNAEICYFDYALPDVPGFECVIPKENLVCSKNISIDVHDFLVKVGVFEQIKPIDVVRKTVLKWIQEDDITSKLTLSNYNAIIEYFASQYSKIEQKLTESEKSYMKKMRVLTCDQTFQKAEICYFDYALPDVPVFECAIPKENLVCSKNISRNVHDFLVKLGVSKHMKPIDIVRKTVLKWIQEGTIKTKIDVNNHQDVLNYIAEKLGTLYEFEQCERDYFVKFPILTKGNAFKEANHCYWQTEDENIPGIESIISCDDFISSEYTLPKIKDLLKNEYFGVRSLKFEDIYEKYCNNLNNRENIGWFFSNLILYWKRKSSCFVSRLLTCVKEKLETSYLLAKNDRSYLPSELYTSRFCNISIIDPDCLPILDYDIVPKDLEKFLGFKMDLEMTCILKLLEAFDKKQEKGTLNEEITKAFFTTLLEQLKRKNKKEIKQYTLKLLSNNNVLKPAKELYYFEEENAKCTLNDLYLKRICEMSHEDTLELAILCGVSVLPFHIDASFKKEQHKSSLKEFYLERLSFLVLKESKKRNDPPLKTLKKLYDSVSSIELIECEEICIKYPFGEPVKERFYFNVLKIFVVHDWMDHNCQIHKHIKHALGLKADIDDIMSIMSMRSVSQEKKDEFLEFEKENPEIFYQIEKEIRILSNEQFYSTSEEDAADPLLQKFNIESRREQAPDSTLDILTLPSKQNQRTVDQQLSESKSHENLIDPFLRSSNIDSGTLNDKPSNYTAKEVIADSAAQTLDIDSVQQQRSDGNTFKENSTPYSKKSSKKQIYDSTAEEDGEYPFLRQLHVDSRQEQIPYNNTLPPLSTQESNKNVNQLVSIESEKETTDELKEFYLERLPFIVVRESKNLNQSPYVILNRLYNRVASIELIQYNPVNRKNAPNIPITENCYFEGLKIYFPGQWTHYKNQIHQHIKQELCLNSNMADILDMEITPGNNNENWVHFDKENLQALRQVEEGLRTLLQNTTKLNEKENVSSCRNQSEQLRDNNVADKITVRNARKTSPKCMNGIEGQHSMTNPTKSGSFVRFKESQEVPNFETIKELEKNEVKVDGNDFNLEISQTQVKIRMMEQDMPGSSQRNLHAGSSHVLSVLKTEESSIQRLNEIYVFTSLQCYYKRKYPNARCTSLSNDYFKLEWESHEIVIIWVNGIKDTDGLFDLSLQKDGEFKQFIEVQPVKAVSDLLNINHSVFLKKNEPFGGLFQERQTFREKFRIYCLVNEDSRSSVEAINEPLALYKIKPLKLLSV